VVRISDQLRKELYIESLKKRLDYLYTYGESHPSEKELIVAKLDGFLEAAGLLQLFSKDELQRVIDERHFAIFGMTRSERARRNLGESDSEEADWTAYETPASQRIGKKRTPRSYSVPKRKTSSEILLHASSTYSKSL
jgi:hypothetical protein